MLSARIQTATHNNAVTSDSGGKNWNKIMEKPTDHAVALDANCPTLSLEGVTR